MMITRHETIRFNVLRNGLIGLLIGCLWALSVAADQAESEQLSSSFAVSADVAAEVVRQSTGGRVLSIKSDEGWHRVKVLLPDGRVHIRSVDAESGELLE